MIKRRSFLAGGAAALACLVGRQLVGRQLRRGVDTSPMLDAAAPPDPAAAAALPQSALITCDRAGRVHVIDVKTGRTLVTHPALHASHAVQLVPGKGRAFVHGRRVTPEDEADGPPERGSDSTPDGMGFKRRPRRAGTGALVVFKIEGASASVELDRDLTATPLHWQPRGDLSEIAYNTTGDESLSIVNTDTLEIEHFAHSAGHHSLMGFLDNDVISSNDLVNQGRVKILDRKAGFVDAEVQVGPWPHGLAVSTETGRAYTWCGDGVHVVGLRGNERGRHLGIIKGFAPGQRCWFAWTPQGGRYSHDASWGPGDTWLPYLTVVDAHTGKLERIETAGKLPGTLTVSDDGVMGLASNRTAAEALVFDLKTSTYKAAIPIGSANAGSFFDRDLCLTPGGRWASVTNPGDPSVSILDLTARREVARIKLTFRPGWTKLILS